MGLPKGRTNNPRGRPPASRAMSALLEQAGAQTVQIGDAKVERKRLVGDMAWQLATVGRAEFPDGVAITLDRSDLDEWLALVKWLYAQVDGPPPVLSNVTLGGDPERPLTFVEVISSTLAKAEEGDADAG